MSTIITKNSATPTSIPSSLTQGELAINVTDGRLFYGSGSGNVVKDFSPFRIATGSISASVNVGSSIFLITNNNIPILTVSQSGVIVLATQSINPSTPAPNGGIYFTSSSLYVGLD